MDKQVRTNTPEDIKKITDKWVGLDKSDMNVLRSVAEFASDVEGFIRLVEDYLRKKNT